MRLDGEAEAAADEFERHPDRVRALREIRCIGRGATGEAILVSSEASGRLYCVKQVALVSEPSPGSLSVEVDVLRRLNHPNVVKYYGAYVEHRDEQRMLKIVMEYADSGTLAQWLASRWAAVPEDERCALIGEEEIMGCFCQIVDGLAHVHSKACLHRDLKAENILLHGEGETLKLSDFGVSRILANTHAMANTCIGTPYYLSPEMVEGHEYSYKSDVWALGVLLYKMATSKPPFQGTNIAQVGNNIRKAEYKALPPRYSADFHYLVAKLLQIEPANRPSTADLQAMPYVSQFAARGAGGRKLRPFSCPEGLPPSRIPVLSRKPSTPGSSAPGTPGTPGARWLSPNACSASATLAAGYSALASPSASSSAASVAGGARGGGGKRSPSSRAFPSSPTARAFPSSPMPPRPSTAGGGFGARGTTPPRVSSRSPRDEPSAPLASATVLASSWLKACAGGVVAGGNCGGSGAQALVGASAVGAEPALARAPPARVGGAGSLGRQLGESGK